MSLDCEGAGATCGECGEFDFLPYTCPRCQRLFCAAHATCHQLPQDAGGSPLTSASPNAVPALCADLPDIPSTAALVDADAGVTPSSSTLRHSCAVCASLLGVLTPCPQCGNFYCAAHRFHGHGRETTRTRQPYPTQHPRAARSAPSDPVDSTAAPVEAAGPYLLEALCAPYTAAHPLALVPASYRSRRMDLLALILVPLTADAVLLNSSIEMEVPRPTPSFSIGVCSLVVATEMSVGQLRDRLVAFLRDTSAESLSFHSTPGWKASLDEAASTPLFSLAPTTAVVADETPSMAPAVSSRRVPALTAVELTSNLLLRQAPILNAAVVLMLTNPRVGGPEEGAAPLSALTELLYGQVALLAKHFSVPRADPSMAPLVMHRDDNRVKALATRLYLQHQQLQNRAAAAKQQSDAFAIVTHASDRVAVDGDSSCVSAVSAEQHATAEVTAPGSCAVGTPGESSPAASPLGCPPVVVVWPFRHQPPLNSFDFFNGKLSPCGVAAIRPSTAPRVVVALFVADLTLPITIKPMCIAVGREWPLSRVIEHLREEVAAAQLTTIRDGRAVLRTFSLYRISSGSPPDGAFSRPTAAAGSLVCLWDGSANTVASATPSTSGSLTVATVLANADVLVLCPPSLSGALEAIEEEILRLRALTGKAKAALRADQLKKCAVL